MLRFTLFGYMVLFASGLGVGIHIRCPTSYDYFICPVCPRHSILDDYRINVPDVWSYMFGVGYIKYNLNL